jgi:CheY-like chemotaxis protein
VKTGLPALRVLIADDNEAARTLLAGILRGVGITQIRQAENGRDAFEGLRHSAPDSPSWTSTWPPWTGSSSPGW